MNIAIVDDHLLFAQSLEFMLKKLYPSSSVAIYTSPEGLLTNGFKDNIPDIVITDLMMPNATDGMGLLEKARLLTGDKTKYIMLTSLSSLDILKKALRKGASGYLTKDISGEEFAEAIEAINRGDEPYMQKSLRKKMINYLLLADEKKPDFALSKKETEVLNFICSGKVPKEIADEMNLSIHTINQYIKALKQKFNVRRTTEIALYAVENGLSQKRYGDV